MSFFCHQVTHNINTQIKNKTFNTTDTHPNLIQLCFSNIHSIVIDGVAATCQAWCLVIEFLLDSNQVCILLSSSKWSLGSCAAEESSFLYFKPR